MRVSKPDEFEVNHRSYRSPGRERRSGFLCREGSVASNRETALAPDEFELVTYENVTRLYRLEDA
ncbi:MAG: hypothetical protein QOK28_2698 [Actinomycetota bacterium]|jgi:hypothetical protein